MPLASVLAGQVQNIEVTKMLSEVAEELVQLNGGKKTFKTMLGGSASKYFQSLRVPDWTLPIFMLQAKSPDLGWQTLLNLTN